MSCRCKVDFVSFSVACVVIENYDRNVDCFGGGFHLCWGHYFLNKRIMSLFEEREDTPNDFSLHSQYFSSIIISPKVRMMERRTINDGKKHI